MVKIRLHGTLEEVEYAMSFIRSQFNVLSESAPYKDRGNSQYYRTYMDCETYKTEPRIAKK